MTTATPWTLLSPHVLTGNPLARFFAPPSPQAEELERGCIFMLPGIESGPWQLNDMIRGLREAGTRFATCVIPWGIRPFGSLPNLVGYKRNRQRAQDLAAEIVRYADAHPGRPVTPDWHRHGHNGGHFGWLAHAWAREILGATHPNRCR